MDESRSTPGGGISQGTAVPEQRVAGFFEALRALRKAEEEAARPYGKGDPVLAARIKELKGYRDVFLKAEAPRRPRFTVLDRKEKAGEPVQVEVSFTNSIQFFEGLELSLSKGGLFVKTDGLVPIDTVLDMQCNLEEEVGFRIQAKVIWLNPRESAGRPAGMGLKLFKLSSIQRQILIDFMNGELPADALTHLSQEDEG
jgi:uncharacterized protein (TIGR02266 family)